MYDEGEEAALACSSANKISARAMTGEERRGNREKAWQEKETEAVDFSQIFCWVCVCVQGQVFHTVGW